MSGPRPLSDSIPRIAGQAFGRKFVMLGRLLSHWPEIAGDDLADKTQPLKLRYSSSKSGGKTVALDIAANPSDSTLLHYRKDLILERINQIFGERLVTTIRFIPIVANTTRKSVRKTTAKPLSPEGQSALSEIVSGVEDVELRYYLNSLGTAILQDATGGI